MKIYKLTLLLSCLLMIACSQEVERTLNAEPLQNANGAIDTLEADAVIDGSGRSSKLAGVLEESVTGY